jgi:hypothetical protein
LQNPKPSPFIKVDRHWLTDLRFAGRNMDLEAVRRFHPGNRLFGGQALAEASSGQEDKKNQAQALTHRWTAFASSFASAMILSSTSGV